jgi:hypothetical protein
MLYLMLCVCHVHHKPRVLVNASLAHAAISPYKNMHIKIYNKSSSHIQVQHWPCTAKRLENQKLRKDRLL